MRKLTHEFHGSWDYALGFDKEGQLYVRALGMLPIVGASSITQVRNNSFVLPSDKLEARDLLVSAKLEQHMTFGYTGSTEHTVKPGWNASVFHFVSSIKDGEAALIPWSEFELADNPAALVTPRIRELILEAPIGSVEGANLGNLRQVAEQMIAGVTAGRDDSDSLPPAV